MILINQLNYKVPEESHAADDLVCYSGISGTRREVLEKSLLLSYNAASRVVDILPILLDS